MLHVLIIYLSKTESEKDFIGNEILPMINWPSKCYKKLAKILTEAFTNQNSWILTYINIL